VLIEAAAALPNIDRRQITLPIRGFSSTPSNQAKRIHPARFRDPYVLTQARARKAANLSKQESLKLRRADSLGDPVRGVETKFVKSFDTAKDPLATNTENAPYLNHFLKQDEIDHQLELSKRLVEPADKTEENTPRRDRVTDDEHQAMLDRINDRNKTRFLDAHRTVEEAVKRITNLDNGSSQDRFRVNVQRCIETFGRHNTDQILPPKPNSSMSFLDQDDTAPRGATVARKGPDTGSSEVQIAVLTARIRHLADHLGRVGSSDKVGKRDLRLLVHRRQKLLQYLRRKERGGPRWQRCIETLGLTEGTWRGEISL